MILPGKFVDKVSDGVFTTDRMILSALEESLEDR